jgi:serine/threonine protein kinase
MATIGNYEITKIISEGGFGRIYQARHILLDEVACIKQCKLKTDEYMELLRQEAKILWRLSDHHSIPHTKDFTKINDGSYIMIMDYIDGTSLDELIPKNSKLHPEDACWITERVLEALYYCHYNGVVHGDIKPGNVIVEQRKHDIKLIDFGLSVYKPNAHTKPIGYTEAFVAPEILSGNPPIPETDLYGAGLILLYALGGNPIIKTIPDNVQLPIKEFCNSLIRNDPMERASWDKSNLVQRISDIRQEVFGRRHTEAYKKTVI